ncbi:holo-ACP synthase [Candidatus Bipolaricaulota sp. J31]
MVDVGVDIVEVKRIREILARRGERFLQRIFTEREIAYALSARPPLREERLAARFAAKEAFLKALGYPVPLKEIEVTNDENGRPRIIFRGRPYPLSISHTRGVAIAVALIPRPGPGAARRA